MPKLFTFSDLINLYNFAKLRNQSKQDYFRFQVFQGKLLIKFLANEHIDVRNKKLLDVGCGFGGYSSAFKADGAEVCGIDFSPILNPDHVPMINGNALQMPFQNDKFDLVICASLLEHVPKPESLIKELLRVLKTGGILYVSFPPFFTPIGGHQFAPYHLLGEKLAISLAKKKQFYKLSTWHEVDNSENNNSFTHSYGKWGLYPLTISRVRNLLKQSPVKFIKQATRYSQIDTSRIPLVGEFITWHVQFLVEKL